MTEEDPAGYQISYGSGSELEVIRLSDLALIGTYATRQEAVAAAKADKDQRA